ncbi:MAG: hypothetical protein WEB03_03015 [Nitriliruptor sp.]|uniref:hypothetical protein n=1 Tax=Nitriliruptor sp. TaxID=2448056 RepID=UPI0034A01A6F
MGSIEHGPTTCLVLWPETVTASSALGLAVAHGGAEVVATVHRWADLLRAAVETHPDVIVLDVAMSGPLGLRLVSVLRHLDPGREVVTVSELAALDLASVEAGAIAAVSPDDLRSLSEVLHRIGAARVQV